MGACGALYGRRAAKQVESRLEEPDQLHYQLHSEEITM